jgi:tRNA-dihydrouridine synthase
LRHARLAVEFEPDPGRAVIEFRKHLGWYTKGLPGGRKLRAELHQVTTLDEIRERLTLYLDETRLATAAA